MKITKEELMEGLPLALMLMYLAYKASQSGQDLNLEGFIPLDKDDGFFFNKYMH